MFDLATGSGAEALLTPLWVFILKDMGDPAVDTGSLESVNGNRRFYEVLSVDGRGFLQNPCKTPMIKIPNDQNPNDQNPMILLVRPAAA